MPNSEQWMWLWRLQIPQRCKIFLWLALNDRLPTNAPTIADSASSPSCPFCHAHETLLHVLRDCPRATSVWIHLVAPHHQQSFFSCSLWDWMVTYLQQPWSTLNSNIIDKDEGKKKDGILFAATVWLLWKERKTWVPDGTSFSPERLLHHMASMADDYGRVLVVENSAPSPDVRNVSWCFFWNQPPSQQQLRVMADSSSHPKL
ncbi:hypothetical protein RIF29_06977 [Crotalaria pallida]|uniref:Reverse transcriptase zinc-binding domain-containing protein n=1 Tax=Crotalaria pallida TaxID=3830 RepID=A0AAN9J4K4_CROPI